jgi:glycosyltransferase involved in cell wall biosynthesis
LSLSDYDNFGYSVLEGITSGLCYFVPDNGTTAYRDYVIDELRFNDIDDLVNKIDYYTNNFEEKKQVVEKQQRNISKFYADYWIKILNSNLHF